MATGRYDSPLRVAACGLLLVAASSAKLALQEPAAASYASFRSLIDDGRYDAAEKEARLLVSAARTAAGSESVAVANASEQLVEALLANGKGADRETREVAQQALRLKERTLAADDARISSALRSLANTLAAGGDAQAALPLLERALLIIERAPAGDQLTTASALEDLGRAQRRRNRYEDAKRSLDRALSIKERLLPPTDRGVADTLEEIVRVLQDKGDYSGARPVLERALAIREGAGDEGVRLAETLCVLGDQLLIEGDSRAAQRALSRAVSIDQRELRPDHPQIAVALRKLSSAEMDLGDVAQATSRRETALAIAEKSIGPAHREIAPYLNDLANAKGSQGDYVGARSLFERAIQVVRDVRYPDGLEVATFEYNLAIIHARLGDLNEARRRLNRAIDIWRRSLGPEHPYVAIALSALGRRLTDQGAYREAQTFFERALAIRERSLGAAHRDVAWNLADLATAVERQGQLARAEQLSSRSLRIWQASNAVDTPGFAVALMIDGGLRVARGDFESARDDYGRAMAIRDRVLGTGHPLYAEAQAGLATALAGTGESAEAIAAALQAEETGRKHLQTTLRYLPERQSLAYAATRPKGLDLAMSLAGTDSGAVGRVFDALVRSRALVLDEMAARHRSRTDASSDVAPLWAALTAARQRLANLVVRGASDQRPEQYLRLVEDARREKERAETALAERSATFRNELSREEVGLDAVRRALPLGSALVAFVRYDRTVIGNTTTTPPQGRRIRVVPSYMAFVAHSEHADVAMVPLGTAASLEALVARWQTETSGIVRASSATDAEVSYRLAGTALRRRLWDPIAGQLKDAINVFVVPDGALNVVTLAALPTGRTTYLIDNGPVIHYLSAERDLVTPAQSAPGRGLLALGGAAFDDPASFTAGRPVAKAAAPRTPVAAATRGVCGDLPSMQFGPLAATSREAQEVASLWTGSPVELLQNHDASEAVFKRSAPGRRVLHLATHGFFLGSDCATPVVGTRGVGGLATASGRRSNAGTADNPLLLSGLALAGANRRAAAGPKDEDGILTAEEVASLNLDGVEWAVLSACDTGLGVVKVGEGVFGLRRAFQVAGVHTVIMSLWQVEDQSAGDWMRALYEGRLKKKLNTAQAVQQASLTVLRDRRAAHQSTHPFYWAGFVATGDWR